MIWTKILCVAATLTLATVSAAPHQHHHHHRHHTDDDSYDEEDYLSIAEFDAVVGISEGCRDILNTIQETDVRIVKLNLTMSNFHSEKAHKVPKMLLDIQAQNKKLTKAVDETIQAVNHSIVLSELESSEVVEKVLVMTPHLMQLLDNIVAHKPDFDHAILHNGSVSMSIASLLKQGGPLIVDLGHNLEQKLSPSYAVMVPAFGGNIQKKYDEMIQLFGQGGDYNMPDLTGLNDLIKMKLKWFGDKIKHGFKYAFNTKYRHAYQKEKQRMRDERMRQMQNERFARMNVTQTSKTT